MAKERLALLLLVKTNETPETAHPLWNGLSERSEGVRVQPGVAVTAE